MTNPCDYHGLWMKAKAHLSRSFHRADGDAFEEAALWAASGLELLSKAALAKVTPVLVADPTEDGRSMLVAAGLSKDYAKFKSIPAKSLFIRCSRAFPPFNEHEAIQMAVMRNEELHSALSPFAGVDQERWWQRYWALAVLLVDAQDETLESLVGVHRVAVIEGHLARNKANVAARVETQIERARRRHESADRSQDAATEIAEIVQRDRLDWEHQSLVDCPACGQRAWLQGDSADQTDVEYDYEDGTAREWLTVLAEGFSCEACGLHLNGAEYVEAAGLPGTFEDERPYEPGWDDYGND